MQKLLVSLGLCAAVFGGLTAGGPADAADGPVLPPSGVAVDPSDPSGNTVYITDPSLQSPDLARAELSGQISVQPTADPHVLTVQVVVRNTGPVASGPSHISLKIARPFLAPIDVVIPTPDLPPGGTDVHSFMIWIATGISAIEGRVDVFDAVPEWNENNVMGIDVWEHAYY